MPDLLDNWIATDDLQDVEDLGVMARRLYMAAVYGKRAHGVNAGLSSEVPDLAYLFSVEIRLDESTAQKEAYVAQTTDDIRKGDHIIIVRNNQKLNLTVSRAMKHGKVTELGLKNG